MFRRTSENTDQMIRDKISIKELIEFERFCGDNANWDEMKKCFSDESSVSISWFEGTGSDFIEASRKMSTSGTHKLYNTVIQLNKDRAVAVVMIMIQARQVLDEIPVELQSDLKLLYRTQRIADVWYITAIEGIYESDKLLSCIPGRDFAIPEQELSKYRPSYANLAYVLSKAGYKIGTDLPGTDQPDSVSRLYRSAEKWLYNEKGVNI